MQIKTVDKGRSHLRGMLSGDEVASWITIIDYHMRIGSANVKMGAIADVNTRPQYRMKGHMRTLMEDTMQYMKDKGYDVSVVMAIPNFYYRFGYASFLPNSTLTIPAGIAEKANKDRKNYRTRKFQKRDSESLLKIYNRHNSERTCSIIREKEYFSGYPQQSQDIFVIENNNGRIIAYAVSSKESREKVTVWELGARTEDAFPALLATFAKIAIKRRVGNIEVFLPPNHPFARFCHRYDCRFSIGYQKNGGGLMQIINQNRLFEKLQGELNSRISQSDFRNHTGSVRLKTNVGSTTLVLDKGDIRVYPKKRARQFLDLPQGQLAQLLAGYRTIKDVLNDANVRASRGVEPLIDVLFPKCNAYIWDCSRFEELRMWPEEFYRGEQTG